MKINIRGEKLEVTNAIKDYAEEKLSKIDKFFEKPDEVDAKVVLKVKGQTQTIEVMIQTKGVILRAEESHSDLYAAIDLVADKLERQIKKNRNKIKSKKNKEKLDDFKPFELIGDDEEEVEKIVKRKDIFLKPMDEEEAILQLELLDHSFFIFNNIDTNSVCVLYKRKDGDYGIINTNK